MPSESLHLPGHTHVAPTADELYDDLAEALMSAAAIAVADRKLFHLALSGGSTPEPFYMRLIMDPRFRALPWPATHLWLVDERRVPIDDPRSNWRMIAQTLADHVPMRSRQKHPMPVESADPAAEYESEIRRVIEAGPTPQAAVPRMDFILLGMGDDAHTASLFPNSPAIDEHHRLIALNQGPHVTPPPRITMTYPLINAARQVAVLVTGSKKAPALQRISQHIQSHGPDPRKLPITGIRPTDGTLTWYLDQPAHGAMGAV